MEIREEILKELKAIAPQLSGLSKANPYKVPEKYFLNFKNVMLERVRLEAGTAKLKTLAPELSKLTKATEPVLPVDYFNKFSANLISLIRVEEAVNELSQIAPELSKLENVYLFRAPQGYFSSFPAQTLTAAKIDNTPVNALPSWLKTFNMVLEGFVNVAFKPRYTLSLVGVAASVALVVMMFVNNVQAPVGTNTSIDKQFASISNDELDAYFNTHADEFYKDILDVSTDDSKLLKRQQRGEISFDKALKDVSLDDLNEGLMD